MVPKCRRGLLLEISLFSVFLSRTIRLLPLACLLPDSISPSVWNQRMLSSAPWHLLLWMKNEANWIEQQRGPCYSNPSLREVEENRCTSRRPLSPCIRSRSEQHCKCFVFIEPPQNNSPLIPAVVVLGHHHTGEITRREPKIT